MSQIEDQHYADVNPDADAPTAAPQVEDGVMRKRSVVIAGHRTSVSLENAFWDALKDISKQQNQTVNQIVTEIDSGRSGNLSSAIRLYILRKLQEK